MAIAKRCTAQRCFLSSSERSHDNVFRELAQMFIKYIFSRSHVHYVAAFVRGASRINSASTCGTSSALQRYVVFVLFTCFSHTQKTSNISVCVVVTFTYFKHYRNMLYEEGKLRTNITL